MFSCFAQGEPRFANLQLSFVPCFPCPFFTSIFFQKANPCNKFKQLTYVDTELSFFQARSRSKPRGQVAQVVMLIREVYKRRNPAKLGEVKRLLEKYKATRQFGILQDHLKHEHGWLEGFRITSVCNGCRGERKRCIRVCAKSMAKSRGHPDGFLQVISRTHTHTHMLKVSYLPPAHV